MAPAELDPYLSAAHYIRIRYSIYCILPLKASHAVFESDDGEESAAYTVLAP